MPHAACDPPDDVGGTVTHERQAMPGSEPSCCLQTYNYINIDSQICVSIFFVYNFIPLKETKKRMIIIHTAKGPVTKSRPLGRIPTSTTLLPACLPARRMQTVPIFRLGRILRTCLLNGRPPDEARILE